MVNRCVRVLSAQCSVRVGTDSAARDLDSSKTVPKDQSYFNFRRFSEFLRLKVFCKNPQCVMALKYICCSSWSLEAGAYGFEWHVLTWRYHFCKNPWIYIILKWLNLRGFFRTKKRQNQRLLPLVASSRWQPVERLTAQTSYLFVELEAAIDSEPIAFQTS